MVSTKSLAWALTCGFFGLQAYAGTIEDWQSPPGVEARSLDLVPIREEELFPNLQKRSDDFTRVHPQDEVRMFFGKAISESHINLANLTVTQPDAQHPILLLERFDDLTESIACTNNDTELALKFRSKDAMDTAIKAWDWVNQNESDFFFLISHHHHNGCGAQEERTPYKITAVQYDQFNLAVILTKQPVTWDETLHNFQLSIGTTDHLAALRKRNAHAKRDVEGIRKTIANAFCGDASPVALIFQKHCMTLKDVGKLQELGIPISPLGGHKALAATVENGLQATLNTIAKDLPDFKAETSTASFTLGKDDPKEKHSMSILKKGIVDAKAAATCTGCFITGNINYRVFASRLDGGKSNLYIDVTPNVKGKMAVDLVGTVTKEVDFNLLATVLNAKLKALVIGNIITIAPEIANGPGVVLKGEVAANITLGFEFNTANASVALSLGSDTQLLNRNWDVATVSPSFNYNSAKVEGQVAPYWRFGIGFGVEIVGKAKLGAFAGFTAQLDNIFTPGACDGPTGPGLIQQSSNFKVDVGYKVLAEFKTGFGLVDGFLSDVVPQPKDGKSLVDHPLEVACKPKSS
ncbi:hypothetical protein TWF696_007975 [Orbilia brochopaga]|uniref:DUF7029 domain-containing protein n=1 Tax=Orbilia brochopaga TaxID=3140254 RepID=A0AAV9ULN9_9PEZI